jgi:DNA topoisomerase I
VPTWLAFAVVRLLEQHFAHLVDYNFTASMEDALDEIARGGSDMQTWLARFYFGNGEDGLKHLVTELGDIDAREISTFRLFVADGEGEGGSANGIAVRVGRYGPYVEDGEGNRANVPDDLPPDELSLERARELLSQPAGAEHELGVEPDSGRTIVAKAGRLGHYVTEVLPEDSPKATKPRTASLFQSMSLDTVTLDDALRLLSLPRSLGKDPDGGEEITAQNGRYGPYVKKGSDSRSLGAEEELFTVTLDGAVELFKQPKARGRRGAASAPLRELGDDPETGKPVVIKDGRFGPYVTDGEVNATLRRDDEVDTVTLDRAADLLAEKRAKGPSPRRRTAKKATKRTSSKKAATKKAATTKKTASTKKTTAKKSTAKKSTTKKATAKKR